MAHDPVIQGSFQYIDRQIRKGSKQDLGVAFERLCKFYLENSPKYKGVFKKVWFWKDWPKREFRDIGIDLIAETRDGEIWAIQAKGTDPALTVSKREIDAFLAASSRPEIKFRLLIASTDNIGHNAKHAINNQQPPVGCVLRGDLVSDDLRWPTHLGERPKSKLKKNPRPHQREAIRDVVNGFKKSSRGKLILACGTGKTLTSLWIREKLGSKRTLFLVPSLSLVNQTLLEWSANATKVFERIVVCSDETVAHSGEDHAISSTADLGIEVTTDADAITKFLKKKRNKPVVVFCTYQSSDRIAAAQKHGAPSFDLAIADEAHRTTGYVESNFSTILDENKIRSKKRLFMTATPRYFTERVLGKAKELDYEIASMDDEAKYGPVFHQLTFGEAIRRGLLSEYQVVIISANKKERKMAEEACLVRTSDGLSTDARTFAAQVGLAKAIKKYDLHKIITFHSSVAKAKRFADNNVADSLPSVIRKLSLKFRPSGDIWASHISGFTPAGTRKTLLNQFASFPKSTRAILTNCACLGEGVDVPTLDGVAFIDPKRSQVDIIQAVGRVIRKAEGVGKGTIVIPVFIDEGEDENVVLSSSAFKPVWQVVRALRAHDEILADKLDELRLKLGKLSPYGGKVQLPASINVDIPTLVFRDFERAFNVRTIETTSVKPNLTIEQILKWVDEFHDKTGKWPNLKSGDILNVYDEKWEGINDALRRGYRGLPGGTSLANLLQDKRNVRNPGRPPNLSILQILKWADEFNDKTGEWPDKKSGKVENAPGETWQGIDAALRYNLRGLKKGSSLRKLLVNERSVKDRSSKLTIKQVLKWVDEYHKKNGKWPSVNSGKVANTKGETWLGVSRALSGGFRGLPSGSSLAKLLVDERGARRPGPLTINQILKWADDHNNRTGRWPTRRSGEVHNSPGETWSGIDKALALGLRGLIKCGSLSKLLLKQGLADPKESRIAIRRITEKQILDWADDHHNRTGKWPNKRSGGVYSVPEQTWGAISQALTIGGHGLPGGSSLPRLLAKERGVENRLELPNYTEKQILKWADAYHKKTGDWPTQRSKEVPGAPKESWVGINSALVGGYRGLSGGSSLAKLLAIRKRVVK